MPSVSAKQHRFMEWIAHSPGAAKKAGVSKSVAQDFVAADAGHKFAEGGAVDLGMIAPGNLDAFDRPTLKNPDGTTSTTLSFSIPLKEGDPREVLIPQVVGGVKLTRPQAIARYRQTGEHLGIFNDWRAADGYAQQLHNAQARRLGLTADGPTAPLPQETFAGAPVPAVSRLLKAASTLHAQSERVRKNALRGATEVKAKGYAEGGAVTKDPQPKPRKGDKERPVDTGDFLDKLSKGFTEGTWKAAKESLDTPEALLGALRHPIRTGKAIYQGALDLKDRAAKLYDQATTHPLATAGSMLAGAARGMGHNLASALHDPAAVGASAATVLPALLNPVEAAPEKLLASAASRLADKGAVKLSDKVYDELFAVEHDTVGEHSPPGHKALAAQLEAGNKVSGDALGYLRGQLDNHIDRLRDLSSFEKGYRPVLRAFQSLKDKLTTAPPEKLLASAAQRLAAPAETISTRLAAKMADHEAAKAEYAALNIPGIAETDGGRILSVDSARELSPEYQADRSRSAEVHDEASKFIKRVYAERIKQPPAPGKVNSVLFTAGGTGAGKTSSIKRIPAVQNMSDLAHTVYDTNMNDFESARKKIQMALGEGKNVDIAYVYRDPIEAMENGTLPRAETKGRTVPVEAHADTHANSFETVRNLMQHYADHPDVRFHVIDNSLGSGNAKLVNFEDLLGKRYNVPAEELRNVVERQYAEGKISAKTYAGTIGKDARGAVGSGSVQPEVGPVAGGEPEPIPKGKAGGAQNPGGIDLNATGGRSVTMQLATAFDNALAHHYALNPVDRAANSRMAAEAVGNTFGRLANGKPRPFLTMNGKLAKANTAGPGGSILELPDGQGIESYGVALSPAYTEGKFTTCPNSASCKALCLGKTSGGYAAYGGGKDLTAFKGPRLTSLQRTKAMLADPGSFAVRLSDEIDALKTKAAANGNKLGIRLNVLSDINPRVHKALIEAHPDVQFYDYTKNNTNPIAPNHHYTYSSTGLTQPKGANGIEADAFNPNQNWKQMRKRLDGGDNVAMGFSSKKHLPDHMVDQETGNTYRVIDGDTHDFRPLDKQPQGSQGVIVGLRNKNRIEPEAGSAVRTNGFFVHFDPKIDKATKLPTNNLVMAPTQSRAAPTLTNDLTVAAEQ